MALFGQHQQFQNVSGAAKLPAWHALAQILRPAATWWPAARPTANLSPLKFWQYPDMLPINGDAAKAQEMYRGIFTFAGQSIVASPDELFQPAPNYSDWSATAFSLEWLRHFAADPKKLTAGYAATLLQAWIKANSQSPYAASQGVEPEAARLSFMHCCFPVLMNQLELPQQRILTRAWNVQLERLRSAKPRHDSEAAQQALALVSAALAVENTGPHLGDGLRRLEIALARSTRGDGGPATSTVAEHYGMWRGLSRLESTLTQRGLTLGSTPAAMLDRIAAFLAMFQRSNGSTAFGLADQDGGPLPIVPSTDIQRLAAKSGVARLRHGRSVVIACSGHGFSAPRIDISVGRLHLLTQVFRPSAPKGVDAGLTEAPEGSLLALGGQQIFMASSGEDIRFQSDLSGADPALVSTLQFTSGTKIMLGRDGCRASIALPDRSHWQISVRGGILKPGDNVLDLNLMSDGRGDMLNWAVKRIADDKTGRTAKASRAAAASPALLL